MTVAITLTLFFLSGNFFPGGDMPRAIVLVAWTVGGTRCFSPSGCYWRRASRRSSSALGRCGVSLLGIPAACLIAGICGIAVER